MSVAFLRILYYNGISIMIWRCMIMNMKHIQYLVEIERVRSISQAAENLYIGQPNLSRILREVEEDIGFPIFLRTNHGVVPTDRGATFLQHARNILREMDSIQTLNPNQLIEDRLRVCIPRSAGAFQLVADFIKTVCENRNVKMEVRECHARRCIEMLSDGDAEIGIIRFREGYENYFQEVATAAKLTFKLLSGYEDKILMHKSHPLAGFDKIKADMLTEYVQIAHGDNFFLPQNTDDVVHSRIYTVDRLAQMTLLSNIPGSFMWSVPQDKKTLQMFSLVQKSCAGYTKRYTEALVYNHQHAMNQIESAFLNKVLSYHSIKE